MLKRILAMVLCVVMTVSMLPVQTFATEHAEEPFVEVTEPAATEVQETEAVEETEPQVTVPVVTEPAATEPVVTEPQETEPEITEPEETEAVETQPEETITDEEMLAASRAIVKSGSCGSSANWSLDSNGTLRIYGTGAMTSYGSSSNNAPWYSHRDTVKSVVVESGITSIGSYAFYDCHQLTSVSIANTVTSIKNGAFYACSALPKITIPNGVTSIGSYAFNNCTSLREATIPSSVISISGSAFYNCSSLKSLYIPSSVTSIGSSAFTGCSSLSITYQGTVRDWAKINSSIFQASCSNGTVCRYGSCGDYAKYTIDSNGVLCIYGTGAMASYGSSSSNAPWYSHRDTVKSVVVESGITSIGSYAFYSCHQLTSASIANTVTSIKNGAFYACSALPKITIPNGVTSIGSYAFNNCTSLREATIPSSVTSISGSAFYNCSSLKTLYIPSSVTSIGSSAFTGCSSLSITYQGTVRDWAKINSSIFQASCSNGTVCRYGSCGDYAKYTIDSNGVLCIYGTGAMASYGSSSSNAPWYSHRDTVKSVVVESGITSISTYAFYSCNQMTQATITDTVTSIKNYAFYGCTALKNIAFQGDAPTIATNAFYNVKATAIYPASAAWSSSDFQNYGGTLSWATKCTNHQKVTLPAVEPTCTGYGKTEGSKCGYCGATLTYQQSIAPLGHDEVIQKGKEATCTETGLTEGKTCSRCSKVLTSQTTIPALGHEEIVDKGITPTCTEPGTSDYITCGRCQSVLAQRENLPALGHAEVIDEAVPVTCTTNGKTEGKHCSRCAETLVAQNIIFAKGHTEVTDEAVPVTCTTNGKTEGTHCSVCGEILVAQTMIPYEGHKMEDGICTVCGEAAITASGSCGSALSWSLNRKGVLAVTGTGAMTNYTSSSLAPWAQYADQITQVVIGEGITAVGNYAFYESQNLTGVTFPSTLKTIGSYAFTRCNVLTGVVLPENLQTIGMGAFNGCKGLTQINIPASVTKIDSYAFEGCSNLTAVKMTDLKAWCGITFGHSGANPLEFAHNLYLNDELITDLVIPSGITSIHGNAFEGGTCFKTISIPQGVSTINLAAFWGCSNVAELNLPTSVTFIDDFAFANWDGLTTLILPNGLKTIGEQAFAGCDNLKLAYIPKSVTSIRNCDSMIEGADGYTGFSGIFARCSEDLVIYCGASSKPSGWISEWNYINLKTPLTTIWGIESMPAKLPEKIEIKTLPTNTWYIVDQPIDLTGLTLLVKNTDGNSETVGPENVAIRSGDTSKAGVIPVTVLYFGQTAQFDIIVHKGSTGEQLQPSSDYPESEHNYANSTNKTWTYSCEGAEYLRLTFSSETKVESSYDYIYIYDGNGVQLGKYSGTSLANKTITVQGDTVKIKLTSDGSYNYYGFSLSSIYAKMPAEYEHEPVGAGEYTAPTCYVDGYWTHQCFCGETFVVADEGSAGHTTEILPAKAATCTETGLTEGSKCVVCKEVLVAQIVIDALGHTWVDADCETPKTCSVCQATEGEALGHRWAEATCTEPKTCSVCQVTEGEALGHTEVIDEAVAPGCTATGLTEGKHCSVCNEILAAQTVVDALGHQYESVVTAPTCTEGGYTTYTCSACNDAYVTDEVEALGHTVVTDAAVAPTCTATGLTEGKHCSVCKETLVARVVIPALDHYMLQTVRELVNDRSYPFTLSNGWYKSSNKSHNTTSTFVIRTVCDYTLVLTYKVSSESGWDKLTIKVNSDVKDTISGEVAEKTLTLPLKAGDTVSIQYYKDGSQSRGADEGYFKIGSGMQTETDNTIHVSIDGVEPTCEEGVICEGCNQTIKPATGHTEVIDEAVAATCTATGKTEGKHCSVCEEVLVAQEVVDALGHAVVTDAAVAPDCTNTGLTEGKHCSVCNEVLVAQETVDALGHTEVIDAAVAATCTATGLTEGKHCSVCNEVLVAQEVVDALGHTEVIDAAVAPTCTETGLTEGKHCSVCNAVLVAQEVVPALGHTVVIDAAVAPDCTNTGLTEGKHCSACNEVLVEQTVVDALGHKYESVVTAPTCTEVGYTTYTCSACGDTYVADEVAALGHTVVIDEAVAPTCAETGLTEGSHCGRCGEILLAQEVIPANTHSFEMRDDQIICAVCSEELIIRFTQDYVVLVEEERLKLDVSPAEFADKIIWEIEDNKESIKCESNVVTAESVGAAFVKATISEDGFEYSVRFRVDVIEKSEIKGVQLSTNKVTTELYKDEYATFEILLDLPQNHPFVGDALMVTDDAAMAASGLENKSNLIKSVQFKNISDLFVLELLDDRTVQIVPTPKAMKEGVKGTPSDTVVVTLRNGQTLETTEKLSLTVKKTLPKLKATIASFNSFYEGQSQKIVITGADVTGIRKNENEATPIPTWLTLEDGCLKLNGNAPKASDKAYLLVDVDGWVDPVELTLTVKHAKKVPGIKLAATTVTVAARNASTEVELKLQCSSKTDVLKDLNITGITAPKGYTVENFNAEDGTFTLKKEGGFTSDEITLTVSYGSATKDLTLNVKTQAVKLKLSSSKVSLNKELPDQAVVEVICATENYNFDLKDAVLTYDGKMLDIVPVGNALVIKLKDGAEYGKTYPVTISAYKNAPAVKLSVAVLKEGSVVKSTIKATGTLDVIREGTAITVTSSYMNYLNVNVDTDAVLKIYSSKDSFKKAIAEVYAENGIFTIDGSIIGNHTLKYKAQLETKIGGKIIKSNQISLSVKMGAAKLTAKSSGTTLFAKDRNDRALVWFDAADASLNDVKTIKIKDAKYKDVFEIIDYRDGSFAVAFKDGKIHESIAKQLEKKSSVSITLSLDVFMEGNESAKANTIQKVKLTIVK